MSLSIESPHKPLLPAQPRWRQVSYIITSYLQNTHHSLAKPFTFWGPPFQSGEGKPHNLFHFNVPLQTREHALAGISGMLRSLAGAQGAFTSRGAKPKGLNLMLLGLTNPNNTPNTDNNTTTTIYQQQRDPQRANNNSRHGHWHCVVNACRSFRYLSPSGHSTHHSSCVPPLCFGTSQRTSVIHHGTRVWQ